MGHTGRSGAFLEAAFRRRVLPKCIAQISCCAVPGAHRLALAAPCELIPQSPTGRLEWQQKRRGSQFRRWLESVAHSSTEPAQHYCHHRRHHHPRSQPIHRQELQQMQQWWRGCAAHSSLQLQLSLHSKRGFSGLDLLYILVLSLRSTAVTTTLIITPGDDKSVAKKCSKSSCGGKNGKRSEETWICCTVFRWCCTALLSPPPSSSPQVKPICRQGVPRMRIQWLRCAGQ